MKAGHLITILLISAFLRAEVGFDAKLAQCIVIVLYGVEDINISDENKDMFTIRLKKIQREDWTSLTYTDFSDPILIRDINNVFLYFNSLPTEIQNEIRQCGLEGLKLRAKKRCEEQYGLCTSGTGGQEMIFFQACPKVFPEQYLDGFCYPECPETESNESEKSQSAEKKNKRKDLYRCPKQMVKILKPYSAKKICEKLYGEDNCIELPSTLWVGRCPEGYSQVLSFLCIPECSPTWISDRKFCQKRSYKTLRTPLVPNFSDLISSAGMDS